MSDAALSVNMCECFMNTKHLCACLKRYHVNFSLKQGYKVGYEETFSKSKSQQGFYVPFNSQGQIGSSPQHCHLWESNPHEVTVYKICKIKFKKRALEMLKFLHRNKLTPYRRLLEKILKYIVNLSRSMFKMKWRCQRR